MKPSAARMARARACASPSTPNTGGPVSTNLLARAITTTAPVGFEGVRRHGNKRSGKGGSSTGGVNGMWRTVSPTKRDSIQVDSRWSRTVTAYTS